MRARVRVRARARVGTRGVSTCCHASSPFCRDTVYRSRFGSSAAAGGGLARTASAMERIAAYCSLSASRTSPPPAAAGSWLTSAGRCRMGARLGLEALWPIGPPVGGPSVRQTPGLEFSPH
eukprot:scaffold86146_cov43-Phaeocystis_antarctica.AAC.3